MGLSFLSNHSDLLVRNGGATVKYAGGAGTPDKAAGKEYAALSLLSKLPHCLNLAHLKCSGIIRQVKQALWGWSPESFIMLWLFLELLSQGPLVICSYCWWGTETSFPSSSNFRSRNSQKDAGLVIKALKSETIREITSVDAGADITLDLLQCPFGCISCSPWSSLCAGRSSSLLVHKTLRGRQAG